jgi:hypothetical protein
VRVVHLLYSLGVACAAAAGFCSPFWQTGFLPLAAGLVWAAYDLTDVEDAGAKPPTAPRK